MWTYLRRILDLSPDLNHRAPHFRVEEVQISDFEGPPLLQFVPDDPNSKTALALDVDGAMRLRCVLDAWIESTRGKMTGEAAAERWRKPFEPLVHAAGTESWFGGPVPPTMDLVLVYECMTSGCRAGLDAVFRWPPDDADGSRFKASAIQCPFCAATMAHKVSFLSPHRLPRSIAAELEGGRRTT